VQAETIAVEADGELPGFEIADAAPWLAQQMDQAHLPDMQFVTRNPGLAAPNRVEWRFDLLPYAGGGVRQFFPQPGAAALKVRYLVAAQVRLYLRGQYQTLVINQGAVVGGAGDTVLADFIIRTTRSLEGAWRATEAPPVHGPVH
jgi:hypothetical protein